MSYHTELNYMQSLGKNPSRYLAVVEKARYIEHFWEQQKSNRNKTKETCYVDKLVAKLL